jgi:transposase
MFVRVKTTKNSPRRTVQIVEGVRQGDKVKQRILCYVGVAQNPEHEEELKALAEQTILKWERERKPILPGLEDAFSYETEVKPGTMVDMNKIRGKDHLSEGFLDVVHTLFTEMGFSTIFGTNKTGVSKTNLLQNLVWARLAHPSSKRESKVWLAKETGIQIPLDRIYRLLDALFKKETLLQQIVTQHTLDLFGGKIGLLLYDVTTLYMESFTEDDLREQGYSKDNKWKETQIVLALAVTPEGLPMGYKLFSGATHEQKTLSILLTEFIDLIPAEKTILVADQGLFSDDNLTWLEDHHYTYVVGAKIRGMKGRWKDRILEPSNYIPMSTQTGSEFPFLWEEFEGDEEEVEEEDQDVSEKSKEQVKTVLNCSVEPEKNVSKSQPTESEIKFPFPDLDAADSQPNRKKPNHIWIQDTPYEKERRLVVSWNRKRAIHDHVNREKLVQSILRRLEKASKEKQKQELELELEQEQQLEQQDLERTQDPSTAEPKQKTKHVKAKSKSLILQSAMRKYVKLLGKDATYEINEEVIESEKKWDGFKGIITNDQSLDPLPLLSFYHSLWKVEDSFRLNKHDLSIRPVYVWTKKRIHAHIGICYLAFAMARVMEYRMVLQQGERMSFRSMRDSLQQVASSLMEDIKTGKLYRVPMEMNPEAKKIYTVLSMKRSQTPTEIKSVNLYLHRNDYPYR